MSNLEILYITIKQQDSFINMLRCKVEALEGILKNHIPNFEEQYARNLVISEHNQRERINEILDPDRSDIHKS